ncbi:MAG: hypothetical protein LQ338_002693 [Usnochroma carphineum]|nr:MAG: hypothetical protein LQ338_002693 [Usnochroma carphineum]
MVYRGKEKPSVEIKLTDGQQNAFIPSYTSLDQIQGNVSVTAQVDTKIDQVYITFEGVVKTYVEKIATSSATNGRTNALQCFLRLVQPMEDASFPESGVLKAGEAYTFPFTFAVPDRLLPQICDHFKNNDAVHQAHLQPPPTLGDPLTAVWGKSLMDDMSPDMAVVSYAVKARVTNGILSNGKHNIIADDSKKVRVIPAVPEQPPLVVQDGKEDDYRLRKEKPFKKGTFKGKLGTVVMESHQPRSLRLPPPRTENPCPVTTSATVNLRFDPASLDAQPPRLGCLVTKLKVATFFASQPMKDIPNRSSDFHNSSQKGIFVETVPLSSRCMASAQWDKHTSPDSPPRRDSALSMVSCSNPNIPKPSASYNQDLPYYTAHILVPIILPRKDDGAGSSKIFVPTFHSCLLSRVYVLDLNLSCHTPDTSITVPTMHLKLPMQISAEGSPNARPSISEDEAQAIARRDAAEFTWHPRSVAPPSPEFTEQAQFPSFAPPTPDYAEVAPLRGNLGQTSESMEAVLAQEVGQSSGNVGAHVDMPPPNYSAHTIARPNVSSSSTTR